MNSGSGVVLILMVVMGLLWFAIPLLLLYIAGLVRGCKTELQKMNRNLGKRRK